MPTRSKATAIPGRCRRPNAPISPATFASFHNYVALPRSEAFRIEYWALEEAKLQRMPPEKEFSRKIALVVGGSSGIGRETVVELAKRGAHVVVADLNLDGATAVAAEAAALSSPEAVFACVVDLGSRESLHAAIGAAVRQFGGLDIVINTAAVYPDAGARYAGRAGLDAGAGPERDEQPRAGRRSGPRDPRPGSAAPVVLTSSANAVVPKSGSEPYDVSKTAVNHLIRELAIGLGPAIRVNGIAPATVVAGSSMFPRDRVIGSLRKYNIAFDDSETTEDLRAKLADFYAGRTITRRPITPLDCARAICWLAGDASAGRPAM